MWTSWITSHVMHRRVVSRAAQWIRAPCFLRCTSIGQSPGWRSPFQHVIHSRNGYRSGTGCICMFTGIQPIELLPRCSPERSRMRWGQSNSRYSPFSAWMMLARLTTSQMPESTRRLTQLLRANALYQPVVEIGHQADSLFGRVLRLAQDAGRRQWIERHLTHVLARLLHTEIAEYEVLLDIVHPKNWELDGWIASQQLPLGMGTCVSWTQALGLSSEDLACSAQQHCPVRVLVAPHLVPVFQSQERTSIVSLLEQWVPEEKECPEST